MTTKAKPAFPLNVATPLEPPFTAHACTGSSRAGCWYISDAGKREVAQVWDWPNAEALANLYASAPALAAENAALRAILADCIDLLDVESIQGSTLERARAILAKP